MKNQDWIINLVGRGNYCDGFLVKLEDFLSDIQDPTDEVDFFSPNQWKHITQIEEAAVALKGAIASALEDGLHDERGAPDEPTNLESLLAALQKYYGPGDICRGDESEWEDHMATPPWHGAPMQGGELDMTSLPTFGGTEIANTEGIWSWDETRMLVGDGSNFEIIERKGEGR